ncbi:type 1 fimbrial protein [Salmonella enterica]|uniref:Type 1 fimbrial protein n=2 Tax=Salmonella enterica TaxID=28901 RepID=A0A8F7YJX5_SALER|nr:fimbrial protein [Salmonella enterica]EBF6534049.1 type 1 fimbrial protein [Salmonella enterica subsp. enterica serovar Montevideo]EBH3490681.1 type 1 fimbrial protein [Salmonella enterica subsp. enterica serovar Kentucky]EBS4798425.1 type 1 fimbrial protein [Salmonella enterica subsp. enterica serovar Newport]EBV1772706.1 type 1 fimbrial protein [Salmonella enterica subsp. enterica serovar Muenchen]ECC9274654.1 type 1 fimbrial protein [Salmonella enterica subsp. enterica]ECD3766057.1 type
MKHTVLKSWFRAGLLPAIVSMALSGQAQAVTVNFDGELLDRPCQVAPESLQQDVIFLERPARDFWMAPARSPVEKFTIRLMECDTTSIWKVVKLKFSGTPENNMTGQADYFLKVTGDNAGKLAVGLLDTDGKTPLKLGEFQNNGQGTQIDGRDVLLKFGAFVQATPDAVTQKSVRPGQYTSAANFELIYE